MIMMKAPNFRTLDLNLLRVFDQVMAERNLTRAARNLSMTQPAVSNALNRLRTAMGDKLLVRSGYGVEPTPRALALWPAILLPDLSFHIQVCQPKALVCIGHVPQLGMVCKALPFPAGKHVIPAL